MNYSKLAAVDLPLALHDLHGALEVGDHFNLSMTCAKADRQDLGLAPVDDQTAGPFVWNRELLEAIIDGAGFDIATHEGCCNYHLTRARTLSDSVGPNMSVLIVGLNPSLHAADAGVGFISPSNRFWRAALAAGLITKVKDPRYGLLVDGVGMTDLVKQATAKAAEISKGEFAMGLKRLDLMTALLAPRIVGVVGITGWRAATGLKSSTGLQSRQLGGRPVYLMPNPSGLNAHTNHADLIDHFQRLRTLAV